MKTKTQIMKYLNLLIISSFFLTSCEWGEKKVVYGKPDTSDFYAIPTVKIGGDVDAKIPYLHSPITDNQLPDEYQNKTQVFAEGTISQSWNKAGFKNANHFKRFLQKFQIMVRDRKKEEIVRLIKFPLPNLKDKKEFMNNYDLIFNHTYERAIIDQNPKEIFRDKNGAMVGADGQVWFKPKGDSYVIVNINF